MFTCSDIFLVFNFMSSLAYNSSLQVIGSEGSLPPIYEQIEIQYHLMRRLLGVRSEGKAKGAKITDLSKNEVLLVNIGSLSAGGRVTATRDMKSKSGEIEKRAKIVLNNAVCTEVKEKIAISRKINKHWRLIGWGEIKGGRKMAI